MLRSRLFPAFRGYTKHSLKRYFSSFCGGDFGLSYCPSFDDLPSPPSVPGESGPSKSAGWLLLPGYFAGRTKQSLVADSKWFGGSRLRRPCQSAEHSSQRDLRGFESNLWQLRTICSFLSELSSGWLDFYRSLAEFRCHHDLAHRPCPFVSWGLVSPTRHTVCLSTYPNLGCYHRLFINEHSFVCCRPLWDFQAASEKHWLLDNSGVKGYMVPPQGHLSHVLVRGCSSNHESAVHMSPTVPAPSFGLSQRDVGKLVMQSSAPAVPANMTQLQVPKAETGMDTSAPVQMGAMQTQNSVSMPFVIQQQSGSASQLPMSASQMMYLAPQGPVPVSAALSRLPASPPLVQVKTETLQQHGAQISASLFAATLRQQQLPIHVSFQNGHQLQLLQPQLIGPDLKPVISQVTAGQPGQHNGQLRSMETILNVATHRSPAGLVMNTETPTSTRAAQLARYRSVVLSRMMQWSLPF